MPINPTITELCRRIDALVARPTGERVIVGIVGAPGAGKTTLAEALVEALMRWPADWAVGAPDPSPSFTPDDRRPWIGSAVAHVPMDGFHLADVELDRLARADRKGAPDTFDAAGYAALLQRLRTASEDVWAPAFDREIEQPVAGSIPVLGRTRVIVTEGNYLLRDEPVWRRTRQTMDEVWYLDLDQGVRRERLVARHVRFGKTLDAARAWADGPDQRNADVIEATRANADLVIHEDRGEGQRSLA